MKHHIMKSVFLALAAGLALSACDRREDVPPVVLNPASDPAGTVNTETANTTITPSPDATVQQNPSAGGLATPNDTMGTPGSTGTSGNTGTSGTTPGSVTSPGADMGQPTGTNGAPTGSNTDPGTGGATGSR